MLRQYSGVSSPHQNQERRSRQCMFTNT